MSFLEMSVGECFYFLAFIFSEAQMYVCNKETYGYFPVPMRSSGTLEDEAESFVHTLLEITGESRGQRAEIFLCVPQS